MPRSGDRCPHLRNVLILGLGTGLLPKAYFGLHDDVCIEAVEIEPQMVYVAQTMFGLSQDDRLKIVVEDARNYLQCHNEKGRTRLRKVFDKIFMDITSSGTVRYPR